MTLRNKHLKGGDETFNAEGYRGNFVVHKGNSGTDTITQFNMREDTLDLTRFGDAFTWEELKEHISFKVGYSLQDPPVVTVNLTKWGGGIIRLESWDIFVGYNSNNPETIREVFQLGPATQGDDVLSGTASADTMRGYQGDDVMRGHGGDDVMRGHDGEDEMYGGAGEDEMHGDWDDDEMHGGEHRDKMYGGHGKDKMYGDAGNDFMEGNWGKDEMHGGIGNDRMYGGEGDDELNGDAGDDHLEGNAGTDILRGGAGNDFLDGGADADIVGGIEGNNTLIGGAGNDWLYDGSGDDRFVFAPGSGKDTIFNFAKEGGNDKIDVSGYSGISGFSDLEIRETTSLGSLGGRPVTIIKLGDDSMITLYDVKMDQIDADDFTFTGDTDAYYG